MVAAPADREGPAQASTAPRQGSARPSRARRHATLSVRHALVESVSAHPVPSGPRSLGSLAMSCDSTELIALATAQGVAGRAAERLAPYLAPEALSLLTTRARQDAITHLMFLGALPRVAAALESSGAAWAVLKGPVLAEICYAPTPRGYTDLDLLVSAPRIGEAVDALRAAGADFVEHNWPLMVKKATGELMMSLDGRTVLDVHWHPVNDYPARRRFLLPAAEMLARAERTQLGPLFVPSLERTDFLVQLSCHASLSGGHLLRWLLDIERTVTNWPPDWDELVRRSRQWRVALPVAVSLHRARQTLAASVPEQVIAALTGTKSNRLLVSSLGSWVPAGRLPGGRAFVNGLTRSVRDSMAATLADFARRNLLTLGELRHPSAWGSTDLSLRHNSGGEQGFQRYVSMVKSADAFGHVAGCWT